MSFSISGISKSWRLYYNFIFREEETGVPLPYAALIYNLLKLAHWFLFLIVCLKNFRWFEHLPSANSFKIW